MPSTNVSEIDSNNIMNPYSPLGLIKNPDGSFTRLSKEVLPISPPSPEFDPNNPISVLSKDLPINQENNTWARVYLPHSPTTTKLPIIVYFHGGGFVIGRAASELFHSFCNEIAKEIQAVIVSVDYRLAPEHRLPTAYDDCIEALHWIKDSNDEWLDEKHVDFSRCYLMGPSSGGNLVYHTGLRVAPFVNDLVPIKIQGLILLQPYFGGEERTESEIRLANVERLPLQLSDIMWDISLPVGADRDHEFCNPIVTDGVAHLLEKVKGQGWKVLVTGSEGDILIDRQVELVGMLEEKGIDVVGRFNEGGFHGFEMIGDAEAKNLYRDLKKFVLSL